MNKLLMSLAVLSTLAACDSSDRLNAMHMERAMQMVTADIQQRVDTLNIDTPGYTVRAIGEVGAGSFNGNAVYVGLVPQDGGEPIDLHLEYNYAFTLINGDTDVEVTLSYTPTDAEVRSALAEGMKTIQ